MYLSYKWLNDYLDLRDQKPAELALRFTMSSAEVEGVESLGENLDKVVTAKILEINPHPDAERLQVTKVNNGKEELQVVCGAPNIAVGQTVPLAEIGAVLPGDFKIKKSNKRGVDSFGMLCSGKELEISTDAEGILILPEDTPLGQPLAKILGKDDYLIEIDNKSLTHRPDLWGHYGIAREMAAILDKELKALDFTIPAPDEEKIEIKVEIKDPELCPRYSALALDNITIKDSPTWLQERLLNIGSKPINNVVDATNYVMFELGQPMHAFDGTKIKENTIIIRRAHEGEKLVTLDDIERALNPEMLVIADQDKAVALAGVMGNENTEVDDNTTFVILESANFNPTSIRRTALKLGLRTEASARFEKSLDPNMTVQAIARFYQILKESCPELKVVSKLADRDYSSKEAKYVEVSRKFISQRLGTAIEQSFIETTLKNLGFTIEESGEGSYRVKVPSYRATKDIAIPEDLVEEIGRIYGYDNITPIAPPLPVEPLTEKPLHVLRRQLRNIFSTGFGFREVSNYSFNGSHQLEKLDLLPENHHKLANPLSHEQEYLRTSLIPNMLLAAETNFKNFEKFCIYELGKIFNKEENTEEEYLCAMIAFKKSNEPLFYQVKGLAEILSEKLKLSHYDFRQPQTDNLPSYCHPGRTALWVQGKNTLAYVSEVHPKIMQRFDLNGQIGVLYINVQELLNTSRKKEKFKELPRYPHVPFDVSIMVDKRILIGDVINTIQKTNKQLIRDIKLFDIYEGKNLPEGKKSLAFTINFAAGDHTLNHDEIKGLQNKVIEALSNKGFEVRGA